jgi:hypothetical protein
VKMWYLIIEGQICGIYHSKEIAELEYQQAKEEQAKEDFTFIRDLVELVEVTE